MMYTLDTCLISTGYISLTIDEIRYRIFGTLSGIKCVISVNSVGNTCESTGYIYQIYNRQSDTQKVS